MLEITTQIAAVWGALLSSLLAANELFRGRPQIIISLFDDHGAFHKDRIKITVINTSGRSIYVRPDFDKREFFVHPSIGEADSEWTYDQTNAILLPYLLIEANHSKSFSVLSRGAEHDILEALKIITWGEITWFKEDGGIVPCCIPIPILINKKKLERMFNASR